MNSQTAEQLILPAEIISKGVDWITATAKTGGSKYDMGVLASDTFHRLQQAGEKMKVQKRQGYTGFACEGFFHGEREGGGMIIVSGARAHDLWRAVTSVCDNVSRLDLQVTIWTYLERPHIAKVIHEQIKRGELGIIPIKNTTYIEGHPDGETVNLNKRKSDTSARVYDKASEGRLGLPRTVWRYEIETHRNYANAGVRMLRGSEAPDALSLRLVHSWFTKRGIKPLFEPSECSETSDLVIGRHKGDTMTWFRDILSKTVSAQVRLHGRREVLSALGLAHPKSPQTDEGR